MEHRGCEPCSLLYGELGDHKENCAGNRRACGEAIHYSTKHLFRSARRPTGFGSPFALPERTVRNEIELLREQGLLISNPAGMEVTPAGSAFG